MKAKPAHQTYKPFGYIAVHKAATDNRRKSVLDSNVKPAHHVKPAPSSVHVDSVATRHQRPKSAQERKAIRNMRPVRIDADYLAWKAI